MHMFCFQCQETSEGRGCRFGGVCGKSEETANFQDLLIHVLKGMGLLARVGAERGVGVTRELGDFVFKALYTTVTNTNFDVTRFEIMVREALRLKRELADAVFATGPLPPLPEMATWDPQDEVQLRSKAYTVGVLQTEDPDVRGLREMIVYALKGLSAYAHHASLLDRYDASLAQRTLEKLAVAATEAVVDRLVTQALDTGALAVDVMALLDRTHSEVYGVPGRVRLSIDVRDRPGILVTGHDLKELDDLLHQTHGSGVDVYTHGEMIAAHYYPQLRKHPHLVANYGNSWWRQDVEFASFNGPILVTTNCIVPVADAYRDRIFTLGPAGYPGVKHLTTTRADRTTDFSELIQLARRCPPPRAVDHGEMDGGFGHAQLWAYSDQLLEMVQAGRLRRVVVIAGCDGRDLKREYYRWVAQRLPKDSLILTAGCTKFMFCKLGLGELDGVPRVLDAGQCNDCYSLVAFALRLKDRLGLSDPNALPLSINVAWYDQKAVAVLLALLHLGFKGVRLGPTLPAFFSPGIQRLLQERFNLKGIGTVEADVAEMMGLASL